MAVSSAVRFYKITAALELYVPLKCDVILYVY